MADSAEPLHKIACFYWEENRIGEAVATAQLAAFYANNADQGKHLALVKDILELLRANGNEAEAAAARDALNDMEHKGR